MKDNDDGSKGNFELIPPWIPTDVYCLSTTRIHKTSSFHKKLINFILASSEKMILLNPLLIVVTGTSSGLGLATAKHLLNNDFAVLGIDIQTAEIEHQNYTHVEMNLASVDIEELQ